MSQYRIIKVVNIENKPWRLKEEVVYRPQYKRFFFWINFGAFENNLSTRFCTKWVNTEFDSLKQAEIFLDRQSKVGYYEEKINYKTNRGE
tara:strand:+ start:3458 stop:3727 length:270 start_codon:yes stop_codon:yes gene_type:complete